MFKAEFEKKQKVITDFSSKRKTIFVLFDMLFKKWAQL